MKKIYLVSAISVIVGTVFAIFPFWFKSMWGPQILLVPFTTGILLVLVQDEDRSYKYVPKLLAGSVLSSLAHVLVLNIVDHFKYLEYNNLPFSEKIDIMDIFIFALPLMVVVMCGGLIGLVIRGSSLLLSKNKTDE